MTTSRVWFCTFGDSLRYRSSLCRIQQEAWMFQNALVFDEVCVYNERMLDDAFLQKSKTMNCRGYGYWSWKPQIVLQTLKKMNDGDVLVYSDAGTHLNLGGLEKMKGYIELARTHDTHNIAFQMPHVEEMWNKMDLLARYPSAMQTEKHPWQTGQYAACAFVLQKTHQTVKMVEEWLEVCLDRHLIDDTPSVLPNHSDFKEHRHDQSAWSLIRKKYGSAVLSDETWPCDGQWDLAHEYPFQAMRIRM